MHIETTRCTIRKLSLEDAEDLFAVLSDEAVMRYIEAPFSLSQTEDFIRAAGLCNPPLVYAVVWKETGRVIGHVIFHAYDEEAWEIGWILGKAYWGMGIASELTEALIHQAEAMGISGCVMECHPSQAATAHIAQKYGFACRGESDGCDIYRLVFE
ncbi:MAG: GNAT family N-acetyltransferase [bacterium]|nr:GNAT family N-acetyltransferase [bacterium]